MDREAYNLIQRLKEDEREAQDNLAFAEEFHDVEWIEGLKLKLAKIRRELNDIAHEAAPSYVTLSYVCFDCTHVASTPQKRQMTCPHCREPMFNMGPDFQPPKKSKKKEWEYIRKNKEKIAKDSHQRTIKHRQDSPHS